MKKHLEKYFIYYVSIIIFIISFILSILIQTNEIFKGLIALPAIGSLLSVLCKIWIDNLAHERNIELQNKQQNFILGATSHMAEVVYDKHALFCESYVTRLQKGLQEIYRDGASKNAINIGRELVNIRQEHSTWLTKKIESELKIIETALIEMGAKENLLDYQTTGEDRTKTVERVYRLLGLILGHEKSTNDEESKMAIEEVIEIIREILGINALTDLRIEATKLAVSKLKK